LPFPCLEVGSGRHGKKRRKKKKKGKKVPCSLSHFSRGGKKRGERRIFPLFYYQKEIRASTNGKKKDVRLIVLYTLSLVWGTGGGKGRKKGTPRRKRGKKEKKKGGGVGVLSLFLLFFP